MTESDAHMVMSWLTDAIESLEEDQQDIQKADVSVGVKHHISYFPEKVAWVHQKCHDKIHDPENPITHLIQYEEGDSEKFYKIQHSKK